MMQPGRLGEFLPEVLRHHRLEPRLRQGAAMKAWPQVVGPDIARNCWPLGVREGVLLVGAVNHAWAQTLHLMRGPVMEALNARVGEGTLREIAVRVAERPVRSQRRRRSATDKPRAAQLPPLTREQQQRVRELTAHIEDAQLRAKVRRAVAGLMRRQARQG